MTATRGRWTPARVTILIAVLVAVVAAIPLTAGRTRAFADDTLVGYTIHATAPGLELVYDSTNIPTPRHPAFTGTLPEATTDLETGPTARGFAAISWPGSLAGNLGTTLQQVNFCAPSSIPVVPSGSCLPDQASTVLKQILKPANDPVRAESRAPAGPADASYGTPGALYMTSHASDSVVMADGGVTSVVAPPMMNFGAVTSRSRALLDNDTAVGEAISSTTGIAIGVGLPLSALGLPAAVLGDPSAPLVSIDSVVSKVTATSDGLSGKATGSTVIAGVRVLGMAASIDSKGIHVNDSVQSTDAVMTPLINAAQTALSAIKFQVTYAPQPILKTTGSAATATAQGVILSFVLPDGTVDGSSFVITLGKAVAQADATTSEASDLGSVPDLSTDASLGAVGDTTSVLPATFDNTAAGDLGATGGAVSGGPVSVNGQPASSSAPVPGGKPLGAALVLLALLGAGGLGFGLKRMSDDVLGEAAGMSCPRQEGGSQ